MNPVSVLSLATATPANVLTQADALASARGLIGHQIADFDRLAAVYANAGIERRQLAMPVEWYLSERSFEERTDVYLDAGLDLFVEVAEKALEEAGLGAQAVDAIVTISSTGIATPSLEARAMARLPVRSDVARVPVFGLGCAGGVSGLALASKIAATAPATTVLLVSVELCSLALRTANADKSDLISTALFGDGAAACVVRNGGDGFATIAGSAEKTWPDTLDIMGWQAEPTGLGVVLDRRIPSFARREMKLAMTEMLAAQTLAVEDVDRFICHPGGAKVVDAIEYALALGRGSMVHEREVLRDHGNMSAPTVLFVLERYRAAGLPALSAVSALGPGFTASELTLRRSA